MVPFFERFQLRSEKEGDFLIFKKVVELMKKGEHLTAKGIEKILELRKPMNYGGKNRRTDVKIILAALTGSSETIRRTPIVEKI